MTAVPLSVSALSSLKKTLLKRLPDVRSSHLSEAIAAALGFRTHAALLAALPGRLPGQENDPDIRLFGEASFVERLAALDYEIDAPTTNGALSALRKNPDLIITVPDSAAGIEYRSSRNKAWRNLMVLTVNEALRRKLFTLRPDDNRWPGVSPDKKTRSSGFAFDFMLPSGRPARGWVGDAGFGELSIHAAVDPKEGGWVSSGNAGFVAGDAFAAGWLERKLGAWLQSSPSMFRCRKHLLRELEQMPAEPQGYGDRGRVIL